MPSPAFVRLGPSSAAKSSALSQAPSGDYAHELELECAQVPQDFDEGSQAWIWLGSDNNKGQATAWTQGIRALCSCKEKHFLGGSKYRIVLDSIFLLPRTIEKAELLQASPETYAVALSEAAIIGLNNYSSQVVQILKPQEFAAIAAVIASLLPEVRQQIFERVPDAQLVKLAPRPAPGNAGKVGAKPEVSVLADDDPVYRAVVELVLDDEMGGALLVGVPGTGKSWYARQIARKLTGGDPARMREVQFHPSYQYEDFVEGYIPDPKERFRLVDKHLLQMVEAATHTSDPVVLLIDEFSRTDPSRVLGEAMTYMEGSLRDTPFYLPSGREVSIPKNLIFLATMNPDDRSVDEIDEAMDRRWGKVLLQPSSDKLRDFLTTNGLSATQRAPIIQFFVNLQDHIEVGHAFFRTVKDVPSFQRLWDAQLHFMARKRFRFAPEALQEVRELWEVAHAALAAVDATAPGAAVEPAEAPGVAGEAPAPGENPTEVTEAAAT